MRRLLLFLLLVLVQMAAVLAPAPAQDAAPALVSDDFSTGLDTARWSVVDPLGDGSVVASGQGTSDAVVALSVPAGVSHDPWGTNRALRLMQTVGDGDFEVEVRFDSTPTQKYQMQGLIIEQDVDDWLRFDVHHNGKGHRVFAASTVAGVSSTQILRSAVLGGSAWLRVSRVGDRWSLAWSSDGVTFTGAGGFDRAMTVSAVGPFAANHTPNPAFTAVVDYVFDTAAPIDPEDGGGGAADEVPPTISDVAVAVTDTTATVSWVTDEAATSAVAFGPTTAYEGGTVSDATLVTAHGVVIDGLSPLTTYHYQVTSADAAGNTATTADATFTTAATRPAPSPSLVSDDFSGGVDPARWSVVDPLGDGSVVASGQGTSDAVVRLSVPAGVSHDPWGTNRALRLMQTVGDGDFEVEVRFDSMPTQKFQVQGLIIDQDVDDWLRFDVHHNGKGHRVFAASTVAGVSSTQISQSAVLGGSTWLRVSRVGDRWSLAWSSDGVTFTGAGGFDRAMTVSAVGPFAANHTPNPAFTAVVDYVFDSAAPIVPEDGGGGGADEVPPTISDVAVAVTDTTATVSWRTDEAATSAVSFGSTTAYEGGTVGDATLVTAHGVVIDGLSPQTTYHYQVGSADAAGNSTTTADATFTTPATPPPPEPDVGPTIEVWNGDQQAFGHIGTTQRWVNILGNVSDANGVASLTYSLNGGPARVLSLGPDLRRLQFPGDFNVEVPLTDLQVGGNTVELRATDGTGVVTRRTVAVDRTSGVTAPLPLTVDWSTATAVTDVAQPVDGPWSIDGGGLRPLQLGYDRLVTLGDTSWTDYTVSFTVTVHGLGPDSGTVQSGAPLVGLGMRWDGHTNLKGEQPSTGFYPVGAYAWYRWTSDPKIQLRGSGGSPTDGLTMGLQMGVPYRMVASVTTTAAGSEYHFKMWQEGQREPGYQLHITTTTGNTSGAVVLIAHHVDATFGAVTVTPNS